MVLLRWLTLLLLVISSTLILSAQDTGSAFPITPGSIEGNINNNFYSTRYSFTVVPDDRVVITMNNTSGDLDPYMNLYDPDGDIYLFNDDVPDSGSRNSRIEFVADTAGIYVVEATRFDGETGTTSGTYRLTLTIEGLTQSPVEVDPLSVPPTFSVESTRIEYDSYGSGTIGSLDTEDYFSFGGRQGDFVRVTLTTTDGNMSTTINIRNENAAVISTATQTRPNEVIAVATIPKTGWYLIEVKQQSGSGNYDMYIARLAQSVLEPNTPVTGELTATAPQVSYVFNGTINDSILATVDFENDVDTFQPRITLLNLNQRVLAEFIGAKDRASIVTKLPRSGPYLIQVGVSGTETGGAFTLELRRSSLDIGKLNVVDVKYNESYKSQISDETPLEYYRFSGKVGELVTVSMQADEEMALDPYLILLDSNLNELAFNDTAGSTINARITQYTLPENSDYYIIASRAGLENGVSEGSYTLSLTVGQIELQTGAFTATLNWQGDADLNLFVTEPSGRTVSWSNPNIPSGGSLQIDSNTNCETPTSQPVEHIYWSNTIPVESGDYTVWVWYQNVCTLNVSIPFTLRVTAYGQEVLNVGSNPEQPITLNPKQRYQAVIRVNEPSGVLINSGEVNAPSPQQEASQGGDTLIRYGDVIAGDIRNDVYARFYQFFGEAGDVIAISVETQTGNLDPIVVLRTADDFNLELNDDVTRFNKNAGLQYELEESGQYVIAVTRFGLRDGTTTGAYNLRLQKIAD